MASAADPEGVHLAPQKKRRTVVLAIDSSKNSERAIRWYAENMAHANDDLELFHSVHFRVSHGSLFTSGSKANEQLQEQAQKGFEVVKKLKAQIEQLIQSEGIPATFHARDGEHPGENIVQFAREKQADCIVIGSRGLGTIRRTILGSVSDYVLHHAHIPVIVVPPPE